MGETSKSERYSDLLQRQRAWLDQAVAKTGLPLSQIAIRSGLANTTLTRFRNNPNHRSPLNTTTMLEVAAATGLEVTPDVMMGPPQAHAARTVPGLLREAEAAPYRAGIGGDIVCAQAYDWSNPRETETLWRIYERPFLVAATRDAAFRKPVLVDGDKIIIKGVVTAIFRARRRPG